MSRRISEFVCGHRACGLPVHGFRNGWRHSLGGGTGPIPASQKHKPVPVLRAEWDRAFALGTPREEAMALLAKFRAADQEINGKARCGRSGATTTLLTPAQQAAQARFVIGPNGEEEPEEEE